MNTIWQALAWKEWHEHKWKLVAVLGVLLLGLATLWGSMESMLFSNFRLAILLPIIPLSVLIATSTAAHERSRNTMPFLGALPVSPRKVAIAKLMFGLATCLVPVFIVLALLFAWHACWDWLGVDYQSSMDRESGAWRGPFDLSNWFAATGCGVALWVISIFLWSAAAGVRRADEISAAASALVLMAGVWLGFIGIGYWLWGDAHIDQWFDDHRFVALATAVAPGGFPHSRSLAFLGNPLALCVLGLFIAVHAGLATWFVTQFGRDASPRTKSNRAAASFRQRQDWLAPPRRSTLSAIAWKQFRESWPVVLAGVAGVIVIIIAGLIITARSQRDISETKNVLVASAFFGCIYVGGFTTLVVGIGVFLRDLEPGIHTFWRSRPIAPNTWYWAKFVMGLAVVGLTFLLPMLILPRFASANQFRDMSGGSEIFWLQIITMAAFAAVYSIGIATTCLTRSAVYATVLTIAGLYLGSLLPATALFVFRWLISPTRPEFPLDGPSGQPLLLASLILSAVVATIVGWLCVRNDWGAKSRY